MLSIHLLGPPEILSDGQPVLIQRRSIRLLLFYLACQNNLVARSELADLFWPEENEEGESRKHLREALSKLRKQLPDAGVLVTPQDAVGLDFSRVQVDVRFFLQKFQQITPLLTNRLVFSPGMDEMTLQAAEAVQTWRTPHFMAGVEFRQGLELDQWQAQMAQMLGNSRQQIVERLADVAHARGDLFAEQRWLAMAIEVDPYNDDLNARLLVSYLDAGRRSEAQEFYQTLSKRYQTEMKISLPTPMIELMGRGKDELTSPGSQGSWWMQKENQVPLVGRADELSRLRAAYLRGAPVVLRGEDGMGKTRLVQEFYFQLSLPPRLMPVTARLTEIQQPFFALVNMLRHSIQPEEWKKIPPAWVGPLSFIFPELGKYTKKKLPASSSFERTRQLIFETLAQWLVSLAAGQRLILLLDDAHWCDEATVDFLSFLFRQGFFKRYAYLILCCPPETSHVHLHSFLTQTGFLLQAEDITLRPLNRNEVAELVRAVWGDCPVDLPQMLGRETGGKPAAILEYLRTRGKDSGTALPPALMTGGLQMVSEDRMQRLPPEVIQILSAAAIIGPDFTPDLLEEVAQLDAESVVRAIEILERMGWITPSENAQTRVAYDFTSAAIPEMVLSKVSLARKRLLHIRFAEAIQNNSLALQRYGPAVISLQYENAGRFEDAFHFTLQAALRACSLFSRVEALAAFERAERMLALLQQSLSDEMVYQLYTFWGKLLSEIGDYAAQERAYRAMLQVGEQRLSSLLIGAAYNSLSVVSLTLGNTRQAMLQLDLSVPYLERSGNGLEWIKLYTRRAAILVQGLNFSEAEMACEQALMLLGRLSEGEMTACLSEISYWQALIARHRGWPAQAAKLIEKQLDFSLTLREPVGLARSFLLFAEVQYFCGRLELAAEYLQSALNVSEEVQNPRTLGCIYALAARVALARGNLDDAWVDVQQALDIGETYAEKMVLGRAYGVLGDLYRLLGETTQAEEAYRKVLEGNQHPFELLDVKVRLPILLLQGGRLAEAEEMISETLQVVEAKDLASKKLTGQAAQVLLLYYQGQDQKALELSQSLSNEAALRGYWIFRAHFYWLLAMVAERKGNDQEALTYLRVFLEYVQPGENVWAVWNALLALKRVQEHLHLDSSQTQAQLDLLLRQFSEKARHEKTHALFLNFRQNLYACEEFCPCFGNACFV